MSNGSFTFKQKKQKKIPTLSCDQRDSVASDKINGGCAALWFFETAQPHINQLSVGLWSEGGSVAVIGPRT